MSLISALQSMPEFRELKISRVASALCVEVAINHPDGIGEIRMTINNIVSGFGADPEYLIMKTYGLACVRFEAEMRRGENVP
jgi:hypothetical protein